MFLGSKFGGDLCRWNLRSLLQETDCFRGSELEKRIGIKNPKFEQIKRYSLTLRLESDLKASTSVPSVKVRL